MDGADIFNLISNSSTQINSNETESLNIKSGQPSDRLKHTRRIQKKSKRKTHSKTNPANGLSQKDWAIIMYIKKQNRIYESLKFIGIPTYQTKFYRGDSATDERYFKIYLELLPKFYSLPNLDQNRLRECK